MLTAIVLAGGLGTRLRAVLPDRPKPMAPIKGRPFLEYLLDYWITQGIERFILSVGYKSEMIVQHFGHRYHGAGIEYVCETEPLGTGGGLLQAAAAIKNDTDSFLLLNGDTYFEVSLEKFMHYANQNATDWCFALYRTENNLSRYTSVNISSEGRIESFSSSKTPGSILINGGVYWIRQNALSAFTPDLGTAISLENDMFPKALTLEQKLWGKEFLGGFIDIGIPEDYKRSAVFLK